MFINLLAYWAFQALRRKKYYEEKEQFHMVGQFSQQ